MVTVFTGSRSSNGSNPDVILHGKLVLVSGCCFMHGQSERAVEARARKFYVSVNGVRGKFGGLDKNCGDATIPNPIVWVPLGLRENVGRENIIYSF